MSGNISSPNSSNLENLEKPKAKTIKNSKFNVVDAVYTIEEMKAGVDDNVQKVSNFGLFVLVGGFIAFMLWSTLAPLDEGVPAHGELVLEGNRQVVQHISSGTIEEVLVKNGDSVEKDQPLIKLNQVNANAALEIAKSQYISAFIHERRLKAERLLQDKIDINNLPEDFSTQDPSFLEAFNLQSSLLQTQLSSFNSQISILEENLQSNNSQLESLKKIRKSNETQLEAINKQLDGITQLAKEGYVSRNSQIDLTRSAAQISALVSESESSIARTNSSIASIKLQILNAKQEFQKQIESKLADAINATNTAKGRYDAAKYDAKNTTITAPVSGTVTNLNVHSVGAIISGGQTLLEIVPDDHELVLKVQVPNDLINNVKIGQKVHVSFAAFAHKELKPIEGEVSLVAADSTIDQRTGMSYYLVEVLITEEGYKALAQNKLIPGMAASVIIVKGERTLLNYLLEPILRRLKLAVST